MFGDPSFPIVTMVSLDAEVVAKAVGRIGIESPHTYVTRQMDMKFCLPDSSQKDVCKSQISRI